MQYGKSPGLAEIDHVLVQINADDLHAALDEQLDELAAAAAEVENTFGRQKIIEVGVLPLLDFFRWAAKAVLEEKIVEGRIGRSAWLLWRSRFSWRIVHGGQRS